MSESALDLLDGRTRRDVEALASTINVPAEIVISEMVTGYVRLLREAPGALPRNPLTPLAANSKRRASR